MIKEITRYKSIIIPKYNDKYIIVKDKKYQELTFIGGGCKLNEQPLKCALREFKEETLNSLNISNYIQHPTFHFESRERSKSELRKDKAHKIVVTMQYNVYIVDLTTLNFSNVKRKYNSELMKLQNSETDDILLKSILLKLT